jgi:hypothetical protein
VEAQAAGTDPGGQLDMAEPARVDGFDGRHQVGVGGDDDRRVILSPRRAMATTSMASVTLMPFSWAGAVGQSAG